MAYPDECAGTNVTDESTAGAVSTPTNNKHGTAIDADKEVGKEVGNDADATSGAKPTSAAKPLSGARLRAGWPTSDDGRTGEGTDERCCERQN